MFRFFVKERTSYRRFVSAESAKITVSPIERSGLAAKSTLCPFSLGRIPCNHAQEHYHEAARPMLVVSFLFPDGEPGFIPEPATSSRTVTGIRCISSSRCSRRATQAHDVPVDLLQGLTNANISMANFHHPSYPPQTSAGAADARAARESSVARDEYHAIPR